MSLDVFGPTETADANCAGSALHARPCGKVQLYARRPLLPRNISFTLMSLGLRGGTAGHTESWGEC